MVKVTVQGGNVTGALRMLKRRMLKEGVLDEYKRHLEYEKPTARRKRMKFRRKLRARQAQRQRDKFGR